MPIYKRERVCVSLPLQVKHELGHISTCIWRQARNERKKKFMKEKKKLLDVDLKTGTANQANRQTRKNNNTHTHTHTHYSQISPIFAGSRDVWGDPLEFVDRGWLEFVDRGWRSAVEVAWKGRATPGVWHLVFRALRDDVTYAIRSEGWCDIRHKMMCLEH